MRSREIKCLFTLPVNSTRVGSRVEGTSLLPDPMKSSQSWAHCVPEPPLSPTPPALQPHRVRASPTTLLWRLGNRAWMNSSRGLKASSVPWAPALQRSEFSTRQNCFQSSFRITVLKDANWIACDFVTCLGDGNVYFKSPVKALTFQRETIVFLSLRNVKLCYLLHHREVRELQHVWRGRAAAEWRDGVLDWSYEWRQRDAEIKGQISVDQDSEQEF